MALDRAQVERWMETAIAGNREVVAWVADPANQNDPLYPVLRQITVGLQEGAQWLRWVALRLRLEELTKAGAALTRDVQAVQAQLAALPTPTVPPSP